MHIASFRIENYKSFRATAVVNLTPGFNVVVGQNNVGKTALVEALSLTAPNKPHRSLKSLPTPTTPLPGVSLVEVSFALGRAELIQALAIDPLWVPVPEGSSTGQMQEALRMRVVDAEGNVELVQPGTSDIGVENRFEYKLAAMGKSRVYAFRAERLNVGAHRFGSSTILLTNAANLPEVLDNLQGRNPERFARLNRFVQTIFPVVRRVTVRPQPNDQLEILVWTLDPAKEREDLAIPLAESGTGIGQVLAILYVVLMADYPHTILIDEPQSFLHPGAVRKLIEILKHQQQHQFIITTHSPTALTAADPETLLRLRIEDGETFIDGLDVADARDLRLVLADVGARLSDVFGADNILWVEGRTEELCFPKIMQVLRREQPLLGTAIIGVLHTADFETRRSEATVELYTRLSTGRGLLPPAVGFIFDREGRTAQDRADLERRGNVFLLPRRMYENYLLSPAAIAAAAASIDGFRDPPMTEVEVRAWLNENRWNARYFDPLPPERTDNVWLREVRGDRLLGDVFSHLSEQRVQYDKVAHGVALTDWLLQHAPDGLQEVAQLIAQVLTPRAA